LKKAAQKLLLLWSRDVWAPVAQNKKVFLPHRRPGSFSSEKEPLAFLHSAPR